MATAGFQELREIEALLRRSVIQVGGQGTGFLVDQDLAITCAHLFTTYPDWKKPPETVVIRNGQAVGKANVSCIRTKETPSLPDLAFLEKITWDQDVAAMPAVMIGDEWDVESEYYSFGYPGGGEFFKNGDSLIFKYNGTESLHGDGSIYKKMHGPFRALGGFSGSPILNRSKGKVCGVLAVSLNPKTAEGVLAIPISCAIDHKQDLIDRQRRLHRRTMWWPNLTPGGILWQDVELACSRLRSLISKNVGGAGDTYYQPRAIEVDIQRFYSSESTAMIIVGKSGMGKTTLLARLAQQQEGDNLFVTINSVDLTLDLREFEKDIAEKLGLEDLERHKHTYLRFWATLDEEARWREKQIVLCIDAVNEYNQGKESPRPVMLLDHLDGLAAKLHRSTKNIKLMITCRPETWRQALDSSTTRFRKNKEAYYCLDPDTSDVAWTLPMFTQEEFPKAYAKYEKAAKFRTTYEDLSDLARFYLRDPFLLDLAKSAFNNKEVPREFDTGDLFEHYIRDLKERELIEVVDGLIEAMFFDDETYKPVSGDEEIKRTAIPKDPALATSRPWLYNQLDFSKDHFKGFQLREKNVIREWKVRNENDDPVTLIRFTYDRFAEYMLSKRLRDMILKRTRKGERVAVAARSVIGANLGASQRMAIVHGSIQRCLILLRSDKSQYAAILRSVAQIDARGQWLVISVLARTAKSVDGGLELLTSLLDELSEKEPGSDLRFPVIDAVYRVLRDEDYRLWLEEQKTPIGEQVTSLKEQHLNSLYGYFWTAFRSNDQELFTAAVQYLFFLWKSRSSRGFEDCLAITERLVHTVNPLARMAISKSSRALTRGLAAVFMLVLPDAEGNRFNEALRLSSDAIRRLKLPGLGQKAAFLLNTVLIDYFLKILDQLPNPVQLASLKHYYLNKEQYLPDAEEVISLLHVEKGGPELTVDTFKRLTRNDNSFIVQMLTFVLSTKYERASSDEERAAVLKIVRECFFAEPRSEISEYCSSLSAYHINCFGSHATKASMELMGEMASAILSVRKGRLTISGKRHNFNIIGTYGRALHQNEKIVADQGAMRYALDALSQAKKALDAEYYLYICENLGLLGTLVEPKYLFDVFTDILKEVHALSVDGSVPDLPFESGEIVEARETIMQSLANIRVLYREQVDKYLLEVLESPELYAEIANERTPSFKLSFFFSWSFEQLLFRCLVSHYEEMGSQLLDAFLAAVRCDSASDGTRVVLTMLFEHVAGLAR